MAYHYTEYTKLYLQYKNLKLNMHSLAVASSVYLNLLLS